MIINLCLVNKHNIVDTIKIEKMSKNLSIDEARMIIVHNIDRNYTDIKYKINIFTPYDGDKIINVLFEDNALIRRDLILKNLLND